MWSIAICDDNRWERYELEDVLEGYCQERKIAMETDLFPDGLTLYERMRLGKHYDLIFLDILMLGMDGIQVGKGIRRELDDEETQLVYMSHGTGNADLLVPNHPVEFLRKPFQRENVFQVADEVRRLNFRWKRQFLYHKKGMVHQVRYQEILYFQSSGRKIEIHRADGMCEFYGKLSKILENGLPEQFFQIHQSYIINGFHVVKMSKERVYMKGQKGYLPVSQPYRQTAMGQWKRIGRGFEGNFVK